MGARKWHLKRAEHHLEVADFVATKYVDWAAVALAYAAHQMVHSVLSGDPTLPRDERHPRKHTSPPGDAHGGRGTNQLVNARFPRDEAEAYASLFEAGRRTRYDISRLGDLQAYKLLKLQYATVDAYCKAINSSRSDIPTEAP